MGYVLKGFYFLKSNDFLERVSQHSGSLSLLAKSGDFEVMELLIHEGKEFIAVPGETSHLIEFFYIISGSVYDHTHDANYTSGDLFYLNRLQSPIYFTAETDTKLLYIINESMFFMLSDKIQKLMETIEKVEEKDFYTEKHCNRVMEYSIALAKELQLQDIDLMTLGYASLFHDLGKIEIPIDILQKPSRLTDMEFESIKQHPIKGRALADEINLINMGEIIEQHHERNDGTGYPFGLDSSSIRIEAKIISIVDCYDAMTSDRPYRKKMSQEEAIDELLKYRGIHYDEVIVDTFIHKVLKKSPIE